MIEHERSYVFTHEGAHDFLHERGMSLYYREDDPDTSVENIEDYYLGQGKRIRRVWTSKEALAEFLIEPEKPKDLKYIFTRKTGNKAKGYRFEFEEEVTEGVATALIETAKLKVKKTRKKLPIAQDAYRITMDFIEEPMKIAVLEIEARSEACYPIPLDVVQKLFDAELQECPRCTYALFNRRIGICGAPSSGKSETAKILSHVLNTQYNANAFHVTEFATSFIQKYKKNPNFWEEFFIWHGQHEREQSAELANIVISDCPTFLTYIYLLHLPKDTFSMNTALVLAKIYKRVLFDIQWYSDLIFLELRDYKENAIRYQSGLEEARQIESRIKGFLIDHSIPHRTYNYEQSDLMLKELFYINA